MSSGLNETPRSERVHIGIFGRTNAGKSTLINQICGSEVALISQVKGTTTDPVYKAMELLPVGPVVLIDTPGLDDTSEIGDKRIQKTLDILKKTDFAVLVVPSDTADLSLEQGYMKLLQGSKVPAAVIVNQTGGAVINEKLFEEISLPKLQIDASREASRETIRKFIIENLPQEQERSLVDGLVKEGDTVVLVMPQDIQAPKGRLILPQVQMIRALLDAKCKTLCVITPQLPELLDSLKRPPDLVITDSQAFKTVNEVLPKKIPLTSFSILLSKSKGDIQTLVDGARAIGNLKPGDRVLMMEACTHHALKGDIARQKLPDLLQKYVGGTLEFDVFSGQGFPEDVSDYQLIVHCGGCMINRKNMLTRMEMAHSKGVPITNFGTAIAFVNGILGRVQY